MINQTHSASSSSNFSISSNQEYNNVYINDSNVSVGTIIKRDALHLRQRYHSLDIHGKSIISLGLNSILDLSFTNPRISLNNHIL
ncbi:hypothetical protein G6F37_010253 [Rhizopus arrhizus]|nr:hypothetical protein G6F38_008384 [Rhizopus arrhizus]KAG1153557.1 hypothetical protein G6F37_010253 [Rhizopus arrhizus]